MKEISLKGMGINMVEMEEDKRDIFLTMAIKMAELNAEMEGLKKNLEQKNSVIAGMAQAHERNEVALKFSLALAAAPNCEDPVMYGFELADEFLAEVQVRSKVQ